MAAKKKVTDKPVQQSPEELIKALQALGFKITPPNAEETLVKEEESVKKLGFVESGKRKPKPEIVEYLVAVLGTAHNVGNEVYGPGEVRLPKSQATLFNSLLYQDQLAKQAYTHQNNYRYSNTGCFIIAQGNGQDTHHKFRKVEVSEAQFNSDSLWENAAITAGKFDVAGYNPGIVNQNTVF